MKPKIPCSVATLLLVAVLLAGCGSAQPASDIILLIHHRDASKARYGASVAATIAKADNKTTATDGSGATRVALDSSMTIVEYNTDDEILNRLKDASSRPTAAIVVVLAADGIFSKYHGEQLNLAKAAGIPVVATLLATQGVEDKELLDLQETVSIKQTLEQSGYTGVPTFRADAKQALEGDAGALAEIRKLLDTVRQKVSRK